MDPVAHFLETVNKLSFLANLPPSLQRDPRTSQIESFYRANFGSKQNGPTIKSEILKLQNGSKEYLGSAGTTASVKYGATLKAMTYETVLQQLEDLLQLNKYYE